MSLQSACLRNAVRGLQRQARAWLPNNWMVLLVLAGGCHRSALGPDGERMEPHALPQGPSSFPLPDPEDLMKLGGLEDPRAAAETPILDGGFRCFDSEDRLSSPVCHLDPCKRYCAAREHAEGLLTDYRRMCHSARKQYWTQYNLVVEDRPRKQVRGAAAAKLWRGPVPAGVEVTYHTSRASFFSTKRRQLDRLDIHGSFPAAAGGGVDQPWTVSFDPQERTFRPDFKATQWSDCEWPPSSPLRIRYDSGRFSYGRL